MTMIDKLILPVESYRVGGYAFGERIRRRFGVPAIHLGEDVLAAAGTAVAAIGEGDVVLACTLPGSEKKKSWGGLVIIQHQSESAWSTEVHHAQMNESQQQRGQSPHKTQNIKQHEVFYSIYGHLGGLRVEEGEAVAGGQPVGAVAPALTAENGWWQQVHLHFAIYTGSWTGAVLPGWWRPEQFWRTRLSYWQAPKTFIEKLNLV
ncbi:MAG: hypothetical protein COT71_03720 [Candidatus Andersenbacteria bacterium CG10_big_fil_rev_8_21_14_0_10_54_11]|uniref:Peptidase M23 domain-containing protein n=1 Tax=Candidatus Andersenbacteria bacterium CG10_big_fil_rev_8_21_14_0_10_54_11 TaxID=1974485 RepID=A0A2M6WYN8_9BACT|nr:MAG: hypothetical protein COT71_03720 [Candidatus Andersenbacteria bacterium CG10_big_fil_rev_8_21_14_0_10_54_11]